MRNFRFGILVMLVSLNGLATAAAQNILVVESNADRVVLANGFNGAIINPNYLDIATQAANAGVSSTPIEALEVGNEIWVSDQVADRIWRFARSGSFLGDVGVGELNNIRGMEVVGNTVFVAQGSDGTTIGEGITTIDVPSLTVTGSFNNFDPGDTSYYDVFSYNNELLVTNIDSGNDAIERYSTSGSFLGFFAQSDGLSSFDFAQQIADRSNSNIVVGGFSVPSGVYEFQPDGTPLGIVAGLDFGPRGVFELGNGELLWTNGTFLRTDSNIISDGGSFRYISGTSVVPEPGSLVLLATFTAAALLRRRRHAG